MSEAVSTDTVYSHLAWCNLSRKEGGLGPDLKLPLMSVSPSFFAAVIRTNASFSADPSHRISRDYGVLIEDEGIALRGLFIIDPKGILRYAYLIFILARAQH